jgi:hypothetical protein
MDKNVSRRFREIKKIKNNITTIQIHLHEAFLQTTFCYFYNNARML